MDTNKAHLGGSFLLQKQCARWHKHFNLSTTPWLTAVAGPMSSASHAARSPYCNNYHTPAVSTYTLPAVSLITESKNSHTGHSMLNFSDGRTIRMSTALLSRWCRAHAGGLGDVLAAGGGGDAASTATIGFGRTMRGDCLSTRVFKLCLHKKQKFIFHIHCNSSGKSGPLWKCKLDLIS